MINWIFDTFGDLFVIDLMMVGAFVAVVFGFAWFHRKDRDKWLPPQ